MKDKSDRGVESKIPSKQTFSHAFVEDKRCRRTFVAIINGLTVSQATREGLFEEEDAEEDQDMQTEEVQDDGQSFFIPETGNAFTAQSQNKPIFGSGLNPEASTFTMNKNFGENAYSPISRLFGDKAFTSTTVKSGENASSFSTRFGDSAGSFGTESNSGKPTTSTSLEATEASQPAFASTPFLPSADAQTSSQDKASGSGATSGFGFNSPFTTPSVPTTSSSEQQTSGFTGFNFAKPAQPPSSSAPIPSTAFHFSKPTEPASVQSPVSQPSFSPAFKFEPSTSTPSLQAAQAPLPDFSALAQPKGTLQFLVTIQPAKHPQ